MREGWEMLGRIRSFKEKCPENFKRGYRKREGIEKP